MLNLISQLRNVKQIGSGYIACCPAHEDEKASLSIGQGDDGRILLHCHAGCTAGEIVSALGIGMKDLYPEVNGKREIVATYDYKNGTGSLVYQVVRLYPKDFRQRRPDGLGGWIWNMKGISPLPYRLPELLAAVERGEMVFTVEGERDVDGLAALGLAATCNHGGAGKWREAHSKYFPEGAHVVVIPDNDDPGRDHATKVAKQLTDRGCNVRVVELPGLPAKGDVTDWLTAGGTKEELLRLVTESPGYGEQEWPDPEEIQSELKPVEALPPEIIPEPFRPWLTDIAHRMQCPLDFVAVGAMVVAGAVIGAGCAMRPKQRDNWTIIPNLWGGIVARPSMLKTPALAEILKPLAALELEAKAEYEDSMGMHEAEKMAHAAERDAIKKEMTKSAAGKPGRNMDILKAEIASMKEPEPPTRRRFKTNDTTIEKLGELLNENPRGLLVFRDELVGLLCSWDREDRQQDRAFYLEAWNGYGSFTADRVGRGTIDTENVCLSLLGGIQPGKLTSYLIQSTGDLANDGMVQRFQLLVYPDEPQGWELIDEWPDTEAKNRAFGIIRTLADMDFITAGAMEHEKRPFFRFTEQGQVVFNEWLTELEIKIRQEDNPIMVEHMAKYRSLMPGTALILHLINVAGGGVPGPVSQDAAEMAAAWCEYLESHARRIYGLLGEKGVRAAAELAEKIRAGKVEDEFTIRDIYNRKHWHLLDTKELVQEAVQELVEAGWLREEKIDSTGGRPKQIYHINQKIFSQTHKV